MKRRFWTVLILFWAFTLDLAAQNKLIHEYKKIVNTQIPGQVDTFRFWYIVDSTTSFIRQNRRFYQFTLSEYPLERTGFIAFDGKSGDLVFQKDSSRNNKIRKIFTLRTPGEIEVFDVPSLYCVLIRSEQKNSIIFKVSQKNLVDRRTKKISQTFRHSSHSIYLTQVEFEKGKLYPQSMTFFFPFDEPGHIKITPAVIGGKM